MTLPRKSGKVALLGDRILENAHAISDERARTFREILALAPPDRDLLGLQNIKLALAACDDPETVGACALAIEERQR